MALEVISQILSPTNATYINGVSAERRFSNAVLGALYQKLVEKDGKGVSNKFVTEDDAEKSAQVFVNRIKPIKMKPREDGASKNGASYSANQHYVQTETVGIELLQKLDDPILIPRARQDMIRVDLLATETEIFTNRLNTILNGATAASKLLASWLSDEPNLKVISSSDVSNKLVADRFVEANSLLDEGDEEHGIDIFPEDTRIAVFKVSYRATLKTGGVLVIGGANAAYEILKGSAISVGDKATKSEDGYIGEIDGVPCHVLSNESLGHASEFIGFAPGDLKASPFVGYIASSYANARGASMTKITDVVKEVNGQGIRLLPYVKFGAVSWYPKGNVIISSSEFNPFGFLKSVFASSLASITFKLKSAGSRLYPEITLVSATSSGATVTAVAKDDWEVSHVVALTAYVGTQAKTLAEFIAGYGSATYKLASPVAATEGSVTSEVISTLTVAANEYVNVLAISTDGSIGIKSIKYAG